MQTSLTLLRQRLDDSASATLQDIVAGSQRLRAISDTLARLFDDNAAALRSELAQESVRLNLVSLMSAGFSRFVGREYQYLDLSGPFIGELERSYRQLVETAAVATARPAVGQAVLELIGQHHDRLRTIVDRLLARTGALDAVMRGARPVCAEYTPALQLEILGLSPGDLRVPILDIGCGEEADLVHHLRSIGCAAWGLDRYVVACDHTIQADWFAIPSIEGGWGTIVAHQSFSLHFLHAHLRARRDAERYARAYMAILRTLRPGGSFLYAPGLPFIESLLSEGRYRVTTRPIAPAMQVWPTLRPDRRPDVTAARVTRIGLAT